MKHKYYCRPVFENQCLAKSVIRFWLWSVLAVTFPYITYGQQEQRFIGSFKVDQYAGEADFRYQIVDGDTLLNGPFEIQKSNLDQLLSGKDYSFSFKGAFDSNYPEGFWRFEFGEFQSTGKSQVVDGQYRVSISGTQEEAYGIIRKGKPDGQWVFMLNQIENSAVSKTLFRSAIQFEGGVPQKSFRIENDSSTLVGRFLRNGLAHDEWALYTGEEGETTETWYFDNGLLQEIRIEKGDEVSVTQIFGQSSDSMETIVMDSKYLEVLKIITASSGNKNMEQTGLIPLLRENEGHYQRINRILSDLGESDFYPEFKVKIPQYATDANAQNTLETIKKLVVRSDSLAQYLLNDSHLKLLKRTDSEVDFLMEVLQVFSESHVIPMKELIRTNDLGILGYIPSSEWLSTFWPNGLPDQEIPILRNGSTQQYIGPERQEYRPDDGDLMVLSQMANYATSSIASIHEQLSIKADNTRQQQQFIELEEVLISKSSAVGQRIDTVQNKLPEDIQLALKAISDLMETQLARYSRMEESETKLLEGDAIKRCLNMLNGLAMAVIELPQKREAIQERYKDQVWNPFTATIMDEQVKKRIGNAYYKSLEPYILQQIQSRLSCDNGASILDLMNGLQQRMLALRDEETSKLERKLKKRQSAETILLLFGLEPLKKEK